MFCSPRRPSGVWQLVCLVIVNSVSLVHFGYDQGIFAGALISPNFIATFPQTSHANVSGITSSCFSLGAFFGCLAAFFLGDKLGRKKAVWAGLVLNVVGAVLQTAAFHLPPLIVGRLINGCGISSTCPVFMAETAPTRLRGKLVVLGSLCTTLGFCTANWINYALFDDNRSFQWRFPLGLQLVFPLVVGFCLPFVVESPRWLILRARHDRARLALARLRGSEDAVNDGGLNDDLTSIRRTLENEEAARVPPADILLGRDQTQSLRRLLLSCGTQLMQQFSGVNALGYYLPTLLIQSVGVSSAQARLLAAANASLYLGAAFLCLVLIDMVGRRRLMMYGSVSTGACYTVAAVTIKEASSHPETKEALGAATVAMFFLYYFCYGTSFAKVPWVYTSEVNSIGWRTRAAAAATATNWLGGFITVQFTKVGIDRLGWGFYLLFAGFCWSYLPIVYLFYPETARRTLEDMDEVFTTHGGLLVAPGRPDLTQRSRPSALVDAERRRINEASSGSPGGPLVAPGQ
ncbi:general substrate transporter [Xylariaceae sp. FL0804]|nr:general substrate transporter [Xylariaceae sp. FL0804]